MRWFSATLRFLVLLGSPPEPEDFLDIVVMVEASDFAAATERVLEIGFVKEQRYEAMGGDEVVWRFKEILTLDIVLEESLDGAEVLSRRVALGDESLDCHPRSSRPAQTI